MPELTLEQAIEIGLRYHRNGQLRDAEQIYQQVLQHDPRNADAMHLLGVLAQQARESAVSVEMIRRAIQVKPEVAIFHYNLAEAYRALGKLEESEESLRRTLELDPDYFDAWNNLGLVLLMRGQSVESEKACRAALDLVPELVAAWNNLGNALRVQERHAEAVDAYHRATALKPDFAEAWSNLGISLGRLNRHAEADEALQKAVHLKPEFADAHNNLGVLFYRRGHHEEAQRELLTALRLQPSYVEAKVNLGAVLREVGKPDQTIKLCEEAIATRPTFAEAYNNLALAYKDIGDYERAFRHVERAIELQPAMAEASISKALILKEQKRSTEARTLLERALALDPKHPLALNCLGLIDIEQGDAQAAFDHFRASLNAHPDLQTFSNLLLAINYLPTVSPTGVATEHFAWGQVAEVMLGKLRAPAKPRLVTPRKLRIGYVSPDLKSHPVSYFIQSFLKHHNQDEFDIYAYANVLRGDSVTLYLQSLIPNWRFTSGLKTVDLVNLIREDEIDILVDLAGHTGLTGLPAFAAKPAPVQISMVGYPNTTGLKTVDYRITDARLDPVGQTEQFSSEQLYRMPDIFWCYTPDEHLPPVSTRSSDPRAIRFCSMNNPAKVNAPVVQAWSEILLRTPGATLTLQGGGLNEKRAHDRIARQFEQAGIDLARVEFRNSTSLAEYYQRMSEFDIALDPFPYNGGTTTCHKLWMGVPVVSFAGPTHVSRMGYSILNCVGLGELCGRDVGEYVEIAARLAQDVDHLRGLRLSLRDRLQASPLLDEKKYTSDLEAAYRSF